MCRISLRQEICLAAFSRRRRRLLHSADRGIPDLAVARRTFDRLLGCSRCVRGRSVPCSVDAAPGARSQRKDAREKSASAAKTRTRMARSRPTNISPRGTATSTSSTSTTMARCRSRNMRPRVSGSSTTPAVARAGSPRPNSSRPRRPRRSARARAVAGRSLPKFLTTAKTTAIRRIRRPLAVAATRRAPRAPGRYSPSCGRRASSGQGAAASARN